jgi:hypothetical protein
LYIDARLRQATARDGVAIVPPPPLGADNQQRYEAAVAAAKNALCQQAEDVGYEYQRAKGADDATARAFAKGVTRNSVVLPLGKRLYFKGGDVVTVREALLDAGHFVKRDCLDPVEPVTRDYCARFLRGNRDYTCFVKSFAHGGHIYQLQYDFDTAQAALATCPTALRGITYWSIINKFNLPQDKAAQYG